MLPGRQTKRDRVVQFSVESMTPMLELAFQTGKEREWRDMAARVWRTHK
jgi:hypothetical protein